MGIRSFVARFRLDRLSASSGRGVGRFVLGIVAIFAFVGLVPTGRAEAHTPAPDRCLALSEGRPLLQRAAFRPAALSPLEARITFVGHSTFLIESAAGVSIATDYNDFIRPATVPTIATMNRAHSTHYTDFPDAGIRHVLRGWSETGGAATHDVTVEDVRVRNVPTNIRDWSGGTTIYGNSIFVFEMAGLCIGHLGHLHHTLTSQQLAQIGQLDVVLAPVDGSYTLDIDGMLETLATLRARLVLPMHYFSSWTLGRFLERARERFTVETSDVPTIVVSQATLPRATKILVLAGQ
jgi:L-ascorbate metabolism protein UlaG (beta-lactamase superfamily)